MKIWTHFLSLVALAALTNMACAVDSKHTTAADGSRIAYTVHGSGPIALVFVHGWSCDQDYWDAQTTFFAEQYTVVTVDLAGHGDSSAEREQFTLESFGGDVKAVVEAEKLNEVILIGHSMGGGAIAYAAAELGSRVVALIGIDTLHHVARPVTQEQMDAMLAPFNDDFVAATHAFVRDMFLENTDPKLVESICADMAAAPPAVAINALTHYFASFVNGRFHPVLSRFEAPVYVINGRSWPTDVAANREHMRYFEARYLEEVGHFPMQEDPAAFNAALSELLHDIMGPGSGSAL